MTVQVVTLVETIEGAGYRLQAALTCDQCSHMQFAEAYRTWATVGNLGWHHAAKEWFEAQPGEQLTWYPAVGVAPEFTDVPEHIGAAASEAHRCYSVQAYRGAAALARAVIEASAKDKGITKGNLYSKIEELEKKGHLRAHIKDAAHEIRHLGNDVAHGDFVDPVTAEEAEETLELMAEVLQEVFQSPARIERAKQRRLARQAADDAS